MAEIQPFDSLLKVLLVGDSSVGKSSLLLRFTADQFVASTNPTIGVDFRTKFVTQQNKRLKLTIWDTAGQERFRTLTSSYYRGAHAVIFVYDVTRRETFDSLGEIWMQEVDMYSTIDNAIKMVVANKVDRDSDREVSPEDGSSFAKAHGCLFVETSAKADVAVTQAFEELVLKVANVLLPQSIQVVRQQDGGEVLETPNLLTDAGNARLNVGPGGTPPSSGCCT